MSQNFSVTVEAPINIAIIKYWGKKDKSKNIPLNPSISITLDMNCLKTKTTIISNKSIKSNTISLNNSKPTPFNSRLLKQLSLITQITTTNNNNNNSISPQQHNKIKITTTNNFPTAAGLASSASGFAASAIGLSLLHNIKLSNNPLLLTQIARYGSGSASRSIHGGFVKWFIDNNNNNKSLIDNCYAMQLFNEKYWEELRIIILVVSSNKKKISSSQGMEISKYTSSLLDKRIINVDKRIIELENAIKNRNFEKFSEICMKDSNEFHSICMNSYPPIFYLNNISKLIIELCHFMNKKSKNGNGVCYTFDAGPNAVLICKNEYWLLVIMNVIKYVFGKEMNGKYDKWIHDPIRLIDNANKNEKIDMKNVEMPKIKSNGIEKIIVTKIGCGAKIVTNSKI